MKRSIGSVETSSITANDAAKSSCSPSVDEFAVSRKRIAAAAIKSFRGACRENEFCLQFSLVLQRGLSVCESIKVNKRSAQKFRMTILDTAAIIEDAMALVDTESDSEKFDTLQKFVDELKLLFVDAIGELEDFTKCGFWGKLLEQGSKPPDEKLREYEVLVADKLKDLLSTLPMPVPKAEKWCRHYGGLVNILKNESKILNELSAKLGILLLCTTLFCRMHFSHMCICILYHHYFLKCYLCRFGCRRLARRAIESIDLLVKNTE